MRIRSWVFAILLIAPVGIASAVPRQQQDDSVAAAARRAQEKKAQQENSSKPTKVWNNDNLPNTPGAINVIGQDQSAAGSSATPVDNTATPPATDAKSAASDKSALEGSLASAKEKLADLKADLDVMQRKYALDQQTYYGTTNYAADKAGAAALASEKAEIDDKLDEVATAEKQLADLQSKVDTSSTDKPPAAK
jgi:type I restriction-modification system DNA methylase subunit